MDYNLNHNSTLKPISKMVTGSDYLENRNSYPFGKLKNLKKM